ncbi:MAG: flavodoxin domain-containing protein [Candidatus Saccharibacteria bacterium]
MNTLVVYDSDYGNTEKIAKAIADAVTKTHQVRLLRVGEATPADLPPIDLLVVGSPTQGGMATKALQEYLKKLSPNSLAGVRVAAFDTRYSIKEQGKSLRLLMRIIGFAAPRIATTLRKKGGDLVADPEGFIVDNKSGPLKPGELERATAWMKTITKSATVR